MGIESIENKFVSVVIPVFNDYDLLMKCLKALEHQKYPSDLYEVIVIDNGSDKKVEDIEGIFKNVIFDIELKKGSYAARNKGIRLAKGEIIAFTDSDCMPDKEWLERGVLCLLGIKNCGLVGGRVDLYFKNPDNPTAVELYESVMTLQQKTNIEERSFGATANVFTYKRVLDKVGLFSESMKSGGDYEWGKRVGEAGYVLSYCDDARVSHPARHSLGQLYQRQTRLMGGKLDINEKRSFFVRVRVAVYNMFMMLIPPGITVLRLIKDDRIPGLTNKCKVVVVGILARLLRFLESLRLSAGGSSRR
jgi:glycosyltransferase involved in cell wall biosynthesis